MKNTSIYRYIILILCFSLLPPALGGATFWEKTDSSVVLVNKLLAEMTFQQMLGQLFFLGYMGTEPPAYLLKWIRERNLGGVKIFTRNVQTLPGLAEDIFQIQQEAGKAGLQIPLFVATDQEGGWVRHIKNETLNSPGNLAIGATGLASDAYFTGYYIGRELSLLGINMNYAPDVDIYSNPENSGIGPRAFSSDPLETGLYSLAYYNGMERAGVICTAKHFPGHGGADLDSHGSLPSIPIDFATMWERELLPYRFLIKEGLPAIMTGHIAFPQILGNKTPATLSTYFCTDVLRGKLGFEGVLITDSLEMWGVREEITDFAEISHRAILAGCDMVLIAHSPDYQERSWVRLKGLLETDPVFLNRVKESARRILTQKLRYFTGKTPVVLYPDYQNVAQNIELLQKREAEDFIFQTSCRSVTLLKDKEIPFVRRAGEKVLFLGQYQEFLNEGKKRYPGAVGYEFPYSPIQYAPASVKAEVKAVIAPYDTIVICVVNQHSVDVLKSIRSCGKKIIVISGLTPVYMDQVPWVESSIAIYSTTEVSFRAGIAALAGDFVPGGRLPLNFEQEQR